MPTDRSTPNNSRPLKPTLATTRTAKTPLVPRLAASATPSSGSHATRTPRSVAGSTPRANNVAQDDVTPVKSFLNNNVTPRSSSRKSRSGVGSAQSTPNGTPSGTPVTSRPVSTFEYAQKEQGPGYSGLGVKGPNSAQSNRPRSVVGGNNYAPTSTPRLPLSNIYNHAPESGGTRDAPSMFFHANDARPQEQAPPQKKGPVFFYASGGQDANSRASDVPSPPLSSVGRSHPESKFFHADSLAEARASPPILTPPPTLASPEAWPNVQGPHSLRPPSPAKDNIHLSYRKGASQVIRPALSSRNSALSILSGSHTPELDIERVRRRSSAASAAVRHGHNKSASVSSLDSPSALRKDPSHDLPTIKPSPLHSEKRIISTGSIPESVASAPSESIEALSGLPSPGLLSSTKPAPGQTVLEHMNELAANARRERKVLDLEISNNSLLAINRSLEREMRKQKAELRRFRRMSRAGQFSADATISNTEEFSAYGMHESGNLSDMSEQEEQDDDYEPGDSSESSFDESTMSPSTLAKRDEAHRLRDEKRLRLDLSKHRGLLEDSQKMNQSLKKCLNWTEELIKDAQKALTYQVRVSDVKLGGRVLSNEEQPDTDPLGESRTLLSPWTPPHRATDPLDQEFSIESDRADRDSGVDLDGLKTLAPGIKGLLSPLGSPLTETPSRLPRIETPPG